MSETPRPWLECVSLHPDVLSDYLIEKNLGLPTNAEAMLLVH